MTSLDLEPLLDRNRVDREVPAGAPFDPWRLKILGPDELRLLSPAVQLAYLASYGLLAPTSHNTIPERFRLLPEEHAIEVWLDRTSVLPAADVVGRQAMVNLGCVVANVRCAARAFGWAEEVDLYPVDVRDTGPAKPGEPRHLRIARVRFHPGGSEPAGPDLLRAMLARKIVRAEYDDRVKLPPEAVQHMHDVVHGYEGLVLHLLTDAATLLFFAKFQELAEVTVFNRDAFAMELGDWLLENDSTSLVGMRGREFGLSDEAARRIHRGLRREIELLPDEIASFTKASNVAVRTSAAVAIITVEEDSVPLRVRAGQAFEEIALGLGPWRLATAMQAGVVEVDVPNLALRGRLRTSRRPTAVFRIGRPLREEDWHRPHASRPLLETLLLTDEDVRASS